MTSSRHPASTPKPSAPSGGATTQGGDATTAVRVQLRELGYDDGARTLAPRGGDAPVQKKGAAPPPVEGGVAKLDTKEIEALAQALIEGAANAEKGAAARSPAGKMRVHGQIKAAGVGLFQAAQGGNIATDAEDAVLASVIELIRKDAAEAFSGADATLVQAELAEALDVALAAHAGDAAATGPMQDEKVKFKDAAGQQQTGPASKGAATGFVENSTHATYGAQTDRKKLGQWRTRLQALAAFYRSMMPGATKREGAAFLTSQRPVSGRRQAVVSKALAEIGKTRIGQAKRRHVGGAKTDVGPDGKTPAWAGWRNLKRYNDEAGVMKTDEEHAYADKGQSWCGIFAFWAAGFKWGDGLKGRERARDAEVGDIVVGPQPEGHHGIIVWIEPEGGSNPTIATVEGNTLAGQVARTVSKLSAWTAGVYDIEGEAKPKEDAKKGP